MKPIRILALTLASVVAAQAQLPTLSREQLLTLKARQAERTQAAETWLQQNVAVLQLSPDHSFKLVSAKTDRYGWLRARFTEQYKGVKVIGGSANVHMDPNGKIKLTHRVYPVPPMAVAPAVPASSAIQAVREAVAREDGLLADEDIEAQLVLWPTIEPVAAATRLASGLPGPKVDWRARSFALVHRIDVISETVPARVYKVDANTGQIIKVTSQEIPENANGFHFGKVNLPVVKDHNNVATLLNSARKLSTVHGLFKKNPYKGNWVPFFNVADNWGDGTAYIWGEPETATQARIETPAVDAHYAGTVVLDMFQKVFGRNGLDGKGGAVQLRPHSRENWNNAAWIHRLGVSISAPSATNLATDSSPMRPDRSMIRQARARASMRGRETSSRQSPVPTSPMAWATRSR